MLLTLGAATTWAVKLVWAAAPLSKACDAASLPALARTVAPPFLGGEGDPRGAAVRFVGCADEMIAAHPWQLLAMLGSLYIASQAFALPGPPAVLSFVAGAVYGPALAQPFIACCATTGATLCYLLSKAVASPLLHRFAAGRVAWLRSQVEAQAPGSDLFWYMLFLRLTPAAPNWLINLGSPIVGVPVSTFVAATGLGLIPANVVQAYIGHVLAGIARAGAGAAPGTHGASSSADVDVLQRQAFIALALVACLALVPVLARRWLGKRGKAEKAQ